MLPLAIVQWRRTQATFQASDETWTELIARVRALSPASPLASAILAKIDLSRPTDGKQRRLTFTAQEAQLLWQAAKN